MIKGAIEINDENKHASICCDCFSKSIDTIKEQLKRQGIEQPQRNYFEEIKKYQAHVREELRQLLYKRGCEILTLDITLCEQHYRELERDMILGIPTAQVSLDPRKRIELKV